MLIPETIGIEVQVNMQFQIGGGHGWEMASGSV